MTLSISSGLPVLLYVQQGLGRWYICINSRGVSSGAPWSRNGLFVFSTTAIASAVCVVLARGELYLPLAEVLGRPAYQDIGS